MKTINIPVKLKNKQFTGDFDIIKSEIDNGNTIKSFAFETGEIVFNFDKHTAKAPKLTATEPKPTEDTNASPIGKKAYSKSLEEFGVVYPVVVPDSIIKMFDHLFSIENNGLKKRLFT